MHLAPTPVDDLPVTLPSPWSGAPLATLDYVLRAPNGETRPAQIIAVPFPDEARKIVGGGYVDAVRAAQELASVPVIDTLHRLPINQAHGVLRDETGAYWVAPLGGDHRGFMGPLFIDGDFYRRSGLSVIASKADGPNSTPLQAIVGAEQLIDLRRALRAGVQPIADAIAREGQPAPDLAGTPDERTDALHATEAGI